MSKSRGKSKGKAAVRSRRDEGKEREWRKLLDEQRRGGESVRAFCRKLGVREASFYRWRREVELRDCEAVKKRKTPPVLAPVVFVEEPCGGSAKSRDTSMGETSPAIEIVLGDGITVRVLPHSTREQLDMVLSVLEQRQC